MKRLAVYSVLSGCFLFALMAAAQVITGTIQGTVKDQSGAVLPGAKVTILDQDTGVSRDTVADASGHYSAPLLPVGHYQVTGSMTGFQNEVRSGITLAVGQSAVIDLQLPVGAVSQAVEVTGEAPLVQTTQATVSNLVNDTSIMNLPLNGRDLSQLILLNPAVNYSPYSPANEAYNGFGKRYSISGQRGEDNVFILDGSLIADFKRHIPAGPSGALMGVESTQEFQVITSVPPAQYGRALGGVFNAVSKSGTNQWHGDLFDYLRNDDMDARNFFDPATIPQFQRNDFGGTLGGPIQKDKTFFFVAFEAMRETNVLTTTIVVPTAAARAGILPTGTVTVSPLVAPYLSLFPLPTPGAPVFASSGTADYIYPNDKTYADNFGQVRLDHQFSDSDSFFARYTGSHSGDNFTNYPGGSSDPGGMTQQSALGADLLTLGETHIFSPSMLNTAHFNLDRVTPSDIGIYPVEPSQYVSNPGQTDPPELDPGSGVTGEAGYDTSPTYFTSNRFNFSDDVNKTIGAHQLQFGGMVERTQLNAEFPDRYMGVWSFTDLAEFLSAVPDQYRGSPPGVGTYGRGFRQDFFALYLQDNWRINSRLTLNLGARWEPYTVPTEVNGQIANLRYITDNQGTVGNPYWLNKSWNNIGPRLGLAWSPFASGKTSVRAGFGELFEPNDANLFYTQMVRDPPLAYDFTEPVSATSNFFPSGIEQIVAGNTAGPGYAVSYNNNKSPHVLQYNATVEQQIGANNMFSIGYVGARGLDELTVENINSPLAQYDGVSLAVPVNATLVNPTWSQVVLYGNNAASWYNAMVLSFQRRFSHGFQAQVSYTWQSNLDQADSGQTAGGVTTGGGYMKYPNDFNVDYGRAGYDIANVLTANYSWDIPSPKGMNGFMGHLLSGWQMTGLWTIESGPPLSVLQSSSAALTAYVEEDTSPNAAPCSQLVLGGPQDYFNLNCFSPASSRELGNVGRDTLVGPGLVDWDPSLIKNTTLNERFQLQFRAEVFNVLNRANFGAPATTVFSGTGGPVGGAGEITSTVTTSRQIQLALKLIW